MPSSPRLRRLLVLVAALLLPAAARAAPFSVTYEVTGGEGYGQLYDSWFIQSGRIVVSFPNPGSGLSPLDTVGHSIYLSFLTATAGGGYGGIFRRALEPNDFPQGAAFRGADQTLRANRRAPVCPGGFSTFQGVPNCRFPIGHETFSIRANADGVITRARWFFQITAEDTGHAWYAITGQEVASTPEPTSAALLVLGGVGVAGSVPAARRAWRRRS